MLTAVSCLTLPRAPLLAACDFKASASSPEGDALLCWEDVYGAVIAPGMFLLGSPFESPPEPQKQKTGTFRKRLGFILANKWSSWHCGH